MLDIAPHGTIPHRAHSGFRHGTEEQMLNMAPYAFAMAHIRGPAKNLRVFSK